jgi:LPXTG-motif cell wall-anchored protein
MIAISQRDLPYLVLTVDPILQAYRTDRVAGVEQSCPKPDGDIICDQVSYAPWLNLTPPVAAASTSSTEEGSSSGLLFVLIGVVVLVLAVGAFVVVRRRRADREALEV